MTTTKSHYAGAELPPPAELIARLTACAAALERLSGRTGGDDCAEYWHEPHSNSAHGRHACKQATKWTLPTSRQVCASSRRCRYETNRPQKHHPPQATAQAP